MGTHGLQNQVEDCILLIKLCDHVRHLGPVKHAYGFGGEESSLLARQVECHQVRFIRRFDDGDAVIRAHTPVDGFQFDVQFLR